MANWQQFETKSTGETLLLNLDEAQTVRPDYEYGTLIHFVGNEGIAVRETFDRVKQLAVSGMKRVV